jgi:hypothetical protein
VEHFAFSHPGTALRVLYDDGAMGFGVCGESVRPNQVRDVAVVSQDQATLRRHFQPTVNLCQEHDTARVGPGVDDRVLRAGLRRRQRPGSSVEPEHRHTVDDEPDRRCRADHADDAASRNTTARGDHGVGSRRVADHVCAGRVYESAGLFLVDRLSPHSSPANAAIRSSRESQSNARASLLFTVPTGSPSASAIWVSVKSAKYRSTNTVRCSMLNVRSTVRTEAVLHS